MLTPSTLYRICDPLPGGRHDLWAQFRRGLRARQSQSHHHVKVEMGNLTHKIPQCLGKPYMVKRNIDMSNNLVNASEDPQARAEGHRQHPAALVDRVSLWCGCSGPAERTTLVSQQS